MRILDWESLSAGERRAALARPVQAARDDIETLAREVLANVRAGGDEALRAYSRRFDGAELQLERTLVEITKRPDRAA